MLDQSTGLNSLNASAVKNTVWFLVGPFDNNEPVRYLPIHTTPYRIGRRQDLAMTLPWQTVSNVHAEINDSGGKLTLKDLGSTNGTYVNGRRVKEEVVLDEDDLVQFANVAFRVRRQASDENNHTIHDNACDRALALVQFDKLMSERAVTPYFQPIVYMRSGEVVGYEVLGRSRLFGLENPVDMFRVASQLNLEIELSTMLRNEGVRASLEIPGQPHLFVNTHPLELGKPGLIESLRVMREIHPAQRLTLEIHEAAVTDTKMMGELRAELNALEMGLAYDDFGAGQTRLNELAEVTPDYLKFDISLVRDIHTASPQRHQMLATLVSMVKDLGIVPLAEGVESEEEHQACCELQFELGQGFFYGKPAPAKNFQNSTNPA